MGPHDQLPTVWQGPFKGRDRLTKKVKLHNKNEVPWHLSSHLPIKIQNIWHFSWRNYKIEDARITNKK